MACDITDVLEASKSKEEIEAEHLGRGLLSLVWTSLRNYFKGEQKRSELDSIIDGYGQRFDITPPVSYSISYAGEGRGRVYHAECTDFKSIRGIGNSPEAATDDLMRDVSLLLKPAGNSAGNPEVMKEREEFRRRLHLHIG